MPPKRSAKVVVTKKVVQETVQVSILKGKKKTKEDTQEDNEELHLKSITIEDKEEQGKRHETVQIAVEEEPSTSLEPKTPPPAKPQEEPEREPPTLQEPEEPQPPPPTKPQEEPEQEPQQKQKKEEKDHLGNEKSKGKKRKRRSEGSGEEYKTYVFRVLKQVHPGMVISSKAMTVINNYMADMFERIANEAATLSKYNKRMTLSSREIQGAVKLVLPGDLGKHAMAEGNKAVTNYMSGDDKVSKS
ncbi:hypothetical protein Pint_32033 [Pistacia integerrima]|uniref:Uncharacterized protein n=1 Tax=Pistacia integerrima TaxID=434235 RepID=A0ACC0XQC8_9ROSI|nr:hypothetical protein Pint_32033 [Pistacia integerrima]